MGGNNCAIVGCTANRSRNKGLSFHRLPKKDVQWRKTILHIIKATRVDQFDEKNVCICSRHFDRCCLIENRPVDGDKENKRKNVTLKPGSLPTLFLPEKSVRTKKIPSRKQPAMRTETPTSSESSSVSLIDYNYKDLVNDLQDIPPGWVVTEQKSDQTNILKLNYDGQVTYQINIKQTLQCEIRLNNFLIPQTFVVLIGLKDFLKQCEEEFNFCPGVMDKCLQDYSSLEPISKKHFRHVFLEMEKPGEVKYHSCIRSVDCYGLTKIGKGICTSCSNVKRNITKLYNRKDKTTASNKKIMSVKTPLQKVGKRVLAKALKDSRKKLQKLNIELTSIQKKIEQESINVSNQLHSDLQDILSHQNISDPFIKLFWREQQSAFGMGKRGHKWHPMMIRLAIMLHSQSPSVYRCLQDTGVLKLPGESTLRDYTNFIKPSPGFQHEVLTEIKNAARHLEEGKRWVTLLLDEMSVKSDLVFDKESGNVVGFVNNVNEDSSFKNNVASHCLVFMVVGVNSSMKYSIGWFPTKTATASGIYPLFWEAVGHLESYCNLKVIGVTADKATANMKFFILQGKDAHKTVNLFAPDRHIYFFSDAPHLLKTTRNNIAASGSNKNTKYLWNNGKNILWSHIADIYNQDMSNELSRATKLTYNHIHPTSYSVMKVHIAAQVLSKSVGKAVEHYGGEEAKETSKFILLMDRFFDCLNVRSLYEGENKRKPDLKPYETMDDPRFKFLLEEFLGYIEGWKEMVDSRDGFSKTEKSKMFLSQQTYKGLVMTTKSVVEATRYLLEKGVNFVFTNKFCQDPLEEHFSKHRALGRRSDNPNVYQFGYQENKIRLQRTLSVQLKPRGNIKRRKRENIVVDEEPLKKKKKEQK